MSDLTGEATTSDIRGQGDGHQIFDEYRPGHPLIECSSPIDVWEPNFIRNTGKGSATGGDLLAQLSFLATMLDPNVLHFSLLACVLTYFLTLQDSLACVGSACPVNLFTVVNFCPAPHRA